MMSENELRFLEHKCWLVGRGEGDIFAFDDLFGEELPNLIQEAIAMQGAIGKLDEKVREVDDLNWFLDDEQQRNAHLEEKIAAARDEITKLRELLTRARELLGAQGLFIDEGEVSV